MGEEEVEWAPGKAFRKFLKDAGVPESDVVKIRVTDPFGRGGGTEYSPEAGLKAVEELPRAQRPSMRINFDYRNRTVELDPMGGNMNTGRVSYAVRTSDLPWDQARAHQSIAGMVKGLQRSRTSREKESDRIVPVPEGFDMDTTLSWNVPKGMEKVLGRVKGKRILSVGCGGGDFELALAQKGAKVVGTDISEAVYLARQKRALITESASAQEFQQKASKVIPSYGAGSPVVGTSYYSAPFSFKGRGKPEFLLGSLKDLYPSKKGVLRKGEFNAAMLVNSAYQMGDKALDENFKKLSELVKGRGNVYVMEESGRRINRVKMKYGKAVVEEGVVPGRQDARYVVLSAKKLKAYAKA